MGSNCFTQALSVVKSDCNKLQIEEKYRLALALLNCHQGYVGGRTYPCAQTKPFKSCTAGMSDRDYGAFTEFLSSVER